MVFGRKVKDVITACGTVVQNVHAHSYAAAGCNGSRTVVTVFEEMRGERKSYHCPFPKVSKRFT